MGPLATCLHCLPAIRTARVKRIVILISGRGSNMQALLRCCRTEAWPAQVVAVVANSADAQGLVHAAERGVPTVVVDHRAHATREAFDVALMQAIDAHQPDLVVLAGFMRVLGASCVAHYAGRMINIHPSLLPAFPGLHTHQRALQAGCKAAGATVHVVTADLDHGPIIAQSVVPVLPGDDEQRLAERVLASEHLLLPLAVRWWVHDELVFDGGQVRHATGASQVLM